MLQRALAMSMDTCEAGSGAAPTPARDLNTMTEEEQIAYAMQMSMADAEKAEQTPDSMEVDEKEEDYSEVMNDPAFLQEVLQNLPGVDPQSEAVRKAVAEGAAKLIRRRKRKMKIRNKIIKFSRQSVLSHPSDLLNKTFLVHYM